MKNKYSAVIAIGGLGTRLKEVTNEIPKPLFPILKKGTFQRCCEELKIYGVNNIFVTLGYKSDKFIEEIKKIERDLNLNIEFFIEKQPLGECGALWEIKNFLAEEFFFINGDLIFSIDLERLFAFHKRLDSSITLVTHTSTHPEDSDLIATPNGTRVQKIFSKSKENHFIDGGFLGNAGISLINKEVLNIIDKPDIKKNCSLIGYLAINFLSKSNKIFSYNTTEYIKDMGTPKRLEQVKNDLKSGIVLKKNYKYKQKALFLDRDNTLIECEELKYITNSNQIKYLTKNIKKISIISKSYDLVCIVTNQPQISMGFLTLEELFKINSKVIQFCLSMDLKIDDIIYCPHHPHAGFKGEIEILKVDCFCRKPNPGMILQQSYLKNIDLSKSLLIGDSNSDKLASINAGCKFINVNDL